MCTSATSSASFVGACACEDERASLYMVRAQRISGGCEPSAIWKIKWGRLWMRIGQPHVLFLFLASVCHRGLLLLLIIFRPISSAPTLGWIFFMPYCHVDTDGIKIMTGQAAPQIMSIFSS